MRGPRIAGVFIEEWVMLLRAKLRKETPDYNDYDVYLTMNSKNATPSLVNGKILGIDVVIDNDYPPNQIHLSFKKYRKTKHDHRTFYNLRLLPQEL